MVPFSNLGNLHKEFAQESFRKSICLFNLLYLTKEKLFEELNSSGF
jgi:hypothetical protein